LLDHRRFRIRTSDLQIQEAEKSAKLRKRNFLFQTVLPDFWASWIRICKLEVWIRIQSMKKEFNVLDRVADPDAIGSVEPENGS
jgi:hypothetical protein